MKTVYYNILTGTRLKFNYNYKKPKFILNTLDIDYIVTIESDIINKVADNNTIKNIMMVLLHNGNVVCI